MTMRVSFAIILRTFGSGFVAITSLVLVVALILSLSTSGGVVVGTVAGSFLAGAALGLRVARRMPGLQFPAMAVLALSGVAAAFVIDVPFVGELRELHAGKPIVASVMVAGYAAPGWRIDTGSARDERLSGRRGKNSYGTRRVAPLVPEGWTPAQPVDIWVAGEIRDSGRVLLSHPKFWDEPGGEYVRLVGNSLSGAQLQVGRAASARGLTTAAEPVVVMRAPSVRAAITRQLWALLNAARYPLGAWALMLAVAAAVVVWRDRRAFKAPASARNSSP